MLSENLKQFYDKKSTNSYGYTWDKSAINFISLYTTTKLLPSTAIFVPIAVALI